MADKDSFELVTALQWEKDARPEFVAFHGRYLFKEPYARWYLTAGGRWAVVDSEHMVTYGDDPVELLEDDLGNFPVYKKLAAAMGQRPTILDI